MQLGFADVLVREIVDHPDLEGQTVGTSIVLSTLSSLFCITGMTAFVFLANRDDHETVAVCFLYSLVLVFQAFDLIQCWYQAKLLSKYTSVISLISYIVVSLYRIHGLVTSKGVRWFALTNAFDMAIISVTLFFVYMKKGEQRLSFSWKRGADILRSSKHYILSGLLVSAFAQADKIMLKEMINDTANGYYGAAVYCAGLSGFVLEAIINSFRPLILELSGTDKEQSERRLKNLYSLIIYVSLAANVFVFLFSKTIISTLYGDKYIAAIAPLRIVVWYSTFSFIGSVRNIWILANNKQRYLWVINLFGAVASLILNYSFISLLGVNGAALGALLTQVFVNVIVGYMIRPIRGNNRLLFESLDPRYLLECFEVTGLKRNERKSQ